MFPLTHIWFSEKVLGYRNNLTVLGAVFPDIAITKCLDYEITHNGGWGIYEHFKSAYPSYIDFMKSMVTHTVNPSGLDYYSDEAYGNGFKGYCFQKGMSIEQEVIDACNIPTKFGLWKAHNFIEMGIELNIVDNQPMLSQIMHNGFSDKVLVAEISRALSEYYGVSELTLIESFDKFLNFIELKNLNSSTLAVKYYIQMQQKHNIEIDTKKCVELIEKARVIVQDDFDVFINHCINKVKQLI